MTGLERHAHWHSSGIDVIGVTNLFLYFNFYLLLLALVFCLPVCVRVSEILELQIGIGPGSSERAVSALTH